MKEGNMAEEQRCQEGHRLCANNCGFFGSPATMDLCSKCYRDLRIKEQHASSAKIAVEKSLLTSSSLSPVPLLLKAEVVVDKKEENERQPMKPQKWVSPVLKAEVVVDKKEETERRPTEPQKSASGRCAECRKKVGVVGFMCRCGASYCGAHRYPEKHSCTFDFKAAGREEIARANPVVIADKLEGRI